VAAAVQRALERIVFHVLTHYRQATGQRSLCAAGGVLQNSTLNGKVARSGLFDRVFVSPVSTDCGLALGAAYTAHRRLVRNQLVAPPAHVYWGRPLDPVAPELDRWAGLVTAERVDDVVAVTADLLAAGNVIGWVQGRAELGPRALGNRSILADPRPAANKDVVNGMVKMREAFRPFAPAVRSEDADVWFDIPPTIDAAYMTFVVPVREDRRDALGATTHVDGSSRVQVVYRTTNERFWQLLGAFGARTGTPVLLNTSFNNNHEPIVDSVEDALVCFLTTGLDVLVVGDHVVRKAELVSGTLLGLRPALPADVGLVRGDGFAALLTPTAQVPVSVAACRFLTDGFDGRPPRLPINGDRDALAGEIFDLWQRRLIRLQPSGCRSATSMSAGTLRRRSGQPETSGTGSSVNCVW
jgi:carbamoyltransferase